MNLKDVTAFIYVYRSMYVMFYIKHVLNSQAACWKFVCWNTCSRNAYCRYLRIIYEINFIEFK
jgi:hypothetical protein